MNVANAISNGKYKVISNLKGIGYSKFNNLLVNRYKETADYDQGIFFYIKNLNTKQIYSNTPAGKSKITFAPDKIKYVKIEGSIEVKTKITVAPEEALEIRSLELTNNGNNIETLEVTSYFEPVLSTALQDYAHTAFNNLFLIFKELGNGNILIKRKKRGEKQKDVYAGVTLYTENETIGDIEYEIDKEKFMGKGNIRIPEAIKNSKPFSKNLGLVTDPCMAIKRTVKIMPGETVTLDLIITVAYEEEKAKEVLQNYSNSNTIAKTFELSDGFNVITTAIASLYGSFFYNDLYYLLAGMSAYVTGFDASALSVAGLLIQSVYAVAMLIFPTSVVLIAGLSFFDVSYKQWFKYIWKFVLLIFLIILLVCAILTVL